MKKLADTKLAGFVRRQLVSNPAITDDEILTSWKQVSPTTRSTLKGVRRERTLFQKVLNYSQKDGLIRFYSSQCKSLLIQFNNIEDLLGPAGSDWTWTGEHCEVLLREAIRRTLPSVYQIGKGYIYGTRRTDTGPERSPEIDILIYDTRKFAPVFSMGDFVIVRAESVRAAIQVKRTLDAGTLTKAVENVVNAKKHVLEVCEFNSGPITEEMFTAIVGFEDGMKNGERLSDSYRTILSKHVAVAKHQYFMPNFIGSLDGVFMDFNGLNLNSTTYQAMQSNSQNERIALSFLFYRLINRIASYDAQIYPAFPEQLPLFDTLELWRKPEEPEENPLSSTDNSQVSG